MHSIQSKNKCYIIK